MRLPISPHLASTSHSHLPAILVGLQLFSRWFWCALLWWLMMPSLFSFLMDLLDICISSKKCQLKSIEVTQSCLTLCDPMDCSPPGSSVHGISEARVCGVGCYFLLQGIFCPRDWTHISFIGRWIFFTAEPPGKQEAAVAGATSSFLTVYSDTSTILKKSTELPEIKPFSKELNLDP